MAREARSGGGKGARRDPLSGGLVVFAPARGARPGAGAARIEAATPEELEQCPFCEGRERRTPPEVLALGRSTGAADARGWHIRVVPNLYPAFERQEVVVHAPQHVRSFAQLDDAQVALVAEAWEARAQAARGAGFAYVHALVNEGAAAGATLPHSHSQLVWLREAPPAVRVERPAGLQELAAHEELTIATRGGWALLAHAVGRVPYELLIAGEGALADALVLLREGVARLQTVEGLVPWNAWLHADADVPPHVHVLPRLTVWAGVELGAGISVNPLPPDAAAGALRQAEEPV